MSRDDTIRSTADHLIDGSYPFLFAPASGGRVVTELSTMRHKALYSCGQILMKQSHAFRYTATDR